MKSFQPQYYVYELSDPISRQVFYVGKGKDKRIHEHEKEARKGVCSRKCDKIREIESFGLSILKQKVAFFWSEAEAYQHEAERMLWYVGLTNEHLPAKPKSSGYNLVDGIERLAGYFAYWIVKTDGGKHKVTVDYPGDRHAILRKTLGEKILNDLFPRFFKEASKDQAGRERLIEIFKPYGIALNYGS